MILGFEQALFDGGAVLDLGTATVILTQILAASLAMTSYSQRTGTNRPGVGSNRVCGHSTPFRGSCQSGELADQEEAYFQRATCPCPVIRRSTHSRPALAGISLPELHRRSGAEQSLPRFDRCLPRLTVRKHHSVQFECAGTCHRGKVGFWSRADGWRPSAPPPACAIATFCTETFSAFAR